MSHDGYDPVLTLSESALQALLAENKELLVKMDGMRLQHDVRVTELLTDATALVEEARAARRRAAEIEALCLTLVRVIGDLGKLLPRHA